MAIKMINKQICATDNGYENVCEFVCDTIADVPNLQTQHSNCCTGSRALVIATGDVYIVNTSGVWTKFGG